MKGCFALGLLLLSAVVAQAKFAPVDTPRATWLTDDTAIIVGPAGAMLESDYFRASQTPSATSRIFPCRLKLDLFDKTRLAQSCR
jgi:hypothetical protein